jgi:vitamin B12 transporter
MGVSGLMQADLHKGFEYNLGYDFQRYHGRDEVLLIDGKTEKVQAVFAQLRSTDDLSRRARFAVGARLNHAAGGNNTVWNASGVFDITPNLYLAALAGTSFLLPDAEHLYAIDPDDPKGNPDLKPEKSRNLNITLGSRFDIGQMRPLTVELSAWKRRVENLFSTDNTNPPPGYTSVFVNIAGKVNVSGAELDASIPLGDAFTLGGSYTYSKEIARGTTAQIAGRPRETAKLNLSYAPPSSPFGVDLAVKHVGKVRTTSVTGFGVQQYGDYNVANLSAHLFFDRARRTQLTLRVENAFDKTYATTVSSAVRAGSVPATRFLYQRLGPPRAAFITLSRRFG